MGKRFTGSPVGSRRPEPQRAMANPIAEPAVAPQATDPSLRSRAVRGAAFTFMKYGGGQIIRLAANLLLTRLLFVETFGLMALISVLLQALEMFSDIGIGPSIIRSRRGDDPRFLDTMWTVQIVRGFGVWIIACIAAGPFAQFYGQPVLAQAIPIAGLNAVIAGFASTKQYTLNRHLHLGRVTVLELVAQSVGALAMIALALALRSVWALVLGAMLTVALRTLLSFVLLPGRNNRLRWEPEARAELVGFGRWVFVSTVLTFASQSGDRLLFGKLITIEMLGVYGIGKMMASAPTEAIGHVAMNVVFPFYSRIVSAGQELRSVFARARRPLFIAAGFGLSLLCASGDSVIRLLYDPRYEQAGWVLQMLALGAWFNVLWTTNVAALLALGRSQWMAAITAAKAVATIALIPVGFMLHGFFGAVAALAVAELLPWLVSATAVSRQHLSSPLVDVPLTALVLISSAAGAWAGQSQSSSLLALLIATPVVSAFWLPLVWPVLRSLRGREGLPPDGVR
jgi:O-antigen/teichoic acid export membrane protein